LPRAACNHGPADAPGAHGGEYQQVEHAVERACRKRRVGRGEPEPGHFGVPHPVAPPSAINFHRQGEHEHHSIQALRLAEDEAREEYRKQRHAKCIDAARREPQDERRGGERDEDDHAQRHAQCELPPQREQQHVAGRHEQRNVAQPVIIEAPRQRQNDFTQRGVDQARRERDPLFRLGPRQPVQEQRPHREVGEELAPVLDRLVER